jgi:hypothetical protein
MEASLGREESECSIDNVFAFAIWTAGTPVFELGSSAIAGDPGDDDAGAGYQAKQQEDVAESSDDPVRHQMAASSDAKSASDTARWFAASGVGCDYDRSYSASKM